MDPKSMLVTVVSKAKDVWSWWVAGFSTDSSPARKLCTWLIFFVLVAVVLGTFDAFVGLF